MTHGHTFETTLAIRARWHDCEIEGEIEVRAEYTMTPGQPARTYGPPDDCDPGYPAEIEIDRIEIGTGEKARPWRAASAAETRDLSNRLLEECFGAMVDEAQDDTADRRADYEYQRWKDERMERQP